jgi:hypothetical protein
VPPRKVAEIAGADAVLFLDLKQYGSKYVALNSVTTVEVLAKLVDTRSETILWEGRGFAQQSGNGSGNLIADLIAAAITQAINKKTDNAHKVSRVANGTLFCSRIRGCLTGLIVRSTISSVESVESCSGGGSSVGGAASIEDA